MNIQLRLWGALRKLQILFGANPYLCKTCRYNNARDCRFRVRPRATICEDYRRK